MAQLNDDDLAAKLITIFWMAFVKAAQIPVDEACFDVAIDKGAKSNVHKHITLLRDYYDNPQGPQFSATLECSKCAGEKAAELAGMGPNARVTAEIYGRAFESVKADNCKPTPRKGLGGQVSALARLCG